jgi:hypothetical protein
MIPKAALTLPSPLRSRVHAFSAVVSDTAMAPTQERQSNFNCEVSSLKFVPW